MRDTIKGLRDGLIAVVIFGLVIVGIALTGYGSAGTDDCSHDVIQPICAKCDRVVIAVADVQDGYIDVTLREGDPNDPNRVEFEDKYAWSAEDAAGMETNWSIETYSDITITTDKRTVTISLLGIADCNDAEISRFADFMQLAFTGGFISFDPNVYEVLVDRLVSPKLITSDPNGTRL